MGTGIARCVTTVRAVLDEPILESNSRSERLDAIAELHELQGSEGKKVRQ
jgi:hypothetical protein